MSTPQKEMLARWAPVIIALLGSAVIYGMERQDLANLRQEVMPMEKRLEVFYTRREANTLETLVRDTNSKVDVIYQREMAKK